MRPCPYCGKEIQDAAIVCRYCGLDIERPEWLEGKVRCFYCAEWIGVGQPICPYCKSDLEELREAASSEDASLSLPSVEEDLDFLRRIAGETEVDDPEPPREATAPEPPREPAPEPPPTDPSLTARAEQVAAEERPESPREPAFETRAQEPYTSSGWGSAAEEDPLRAQAYDQDGFTLHLDLLNALEDLPLARIARIGAVLVLILAGAGGAVALATRLRGNFELPQLAAEERTPTAAPTTSPLPTDTPQAGTPQITPSPTSGAGVTGSCVLWDQVSLDDAGQEMCVYGTVKRWFASGDLPFVAIFSEEAGTFALVDRSMAHTSVRPGDCIQGTGPIEVMSATRPYIELRGEVTRCRQEPAPD